MVCQRLLFWQQSHSHRRKPASGKAEALLLVLSILWVDAGAPRRSIAKAARPASIKGSLLKSAVKAGLRASTKESRLRNAVKADLRASTSCAVKGSAPAPRKVGPGTRGRHCGPGTRAKPGRGAYPLNPSGGQGQERNRAEDRADRERERTGQAEAGARKGERSATTEREKRGVQGEEAVDEFGRGTREGENAGRAGGSGRFASISREQDSSGILVRDSQSTAITAER